MGETLTTPVVRESNPAVTAATAPARHDVKLGPESSYIYFSARAVCESTPAGKLERTDIGGQSLLAQTVLVFFLRSHIWKAQADCV